jgi:hypothetical protein
MARRQGKHEDQDIMRHFWHIVVFLVAASWLLTWAPAAQAEQQMRCDLHAIRASTNGTDISPELESYRAQLLRPPLSAFSSFRLLQRLTVALSPGQTSPIRLAHGIGGELRFDSAEGNQRRFNLALRHSQRTLLNTRFGVSRGHPFFVVVGSVIPEGTLVLGILCR